MRKVKNYIIDTENSAVRLPICLCLSVNNPVYVNKISRGIKLFYETNRKDEFVSYSVETSIVAPNGKNAYCVADFDIVDRQGNPALQAGRTTSLGDEVNLALDLVNKRIEEYKNVGIDYHRPWLVLLADNTPCENLSELRAISRMASMVNNKKLTVFPVGIGKKAGMDILKQLSPARQPLKLQEQKFKEFFMWLSESASRVSWHMQTAS
jgi:uncharacterized protein YegL